MPWSEYSYWLRCNRPWNADLDVYNCRCLTMFIKKIKSCCLFLWYFSCRRWYIPYIKIPRWINLQHYYTQTGAVADIGAIEAANWSSCTILERTGAIGAANWSSCTILERTGAIGETIRRILEQLQILERQTGVYWSS